MNIKIDSSQLITIKNKFDSELSELETNINNLVVEINNIRSVWKSNDAESFINTANNKLIESLRNVKKALDDYENNIDVIAKSYDALDQAFSNKKVEV